VASGKTFELFVAKGAAPSDKQLLEELEQIPPDSVARNLL